MKKPFIDLYEDEDEIQAAKREWAKNAPLPKRQPDQNPITPIVPKGVTYTPEKKLAPPTPPAPPAEQGLSEVVGLPEYERDTEREERLKKAAKWGSIADALRLVGQSVYASKGANVVPMQGLGQNSTNQLNALTEKWADQDYKNKMIRYQDEMQKINLANRKEEIEANRAFQAEQAEAGRAFQSGEAEKNRTFQANQAAENRATQVGLTDRQYEQRLKEIDATAERQLRLQLAQEGRQLRVEELRAANRLAVEQARGVTAQYRRVNNREPHSVLYDLEEERAIPLDNQSQATAMFNVIMDDPDPALANDPTLMRLRNERARGGVAPDVIQQIVETYWTKSTLAKAAAEKFLKINLKGVEAGVIQDPTAPAGQPAKDPSKELEQWLSQPDDDWWK